MTSTIAPWQVWWFDFDPVEGHEQAGTRSGLIISSPFHLKLTGNKLVNVVPVTSTERFDLLHRVFINSPKDGKKWVLTEQIRTMSVGRIDRSRGCWKLNPDEIARVREVLRHMVDL
ncbi:type II toxin-antitoxin system PemK/MazF family toxin [Actinoplanes derwentensis]|uniref:mRNA interferase MazF n=1 Tax=Actinoplanes derwentensis TaxID=113562 RepID=A0A1H1U366_9ACTN|nr:type II toxin-antitoxin system PemK/MazF family toxin [Actinoplanes derwentensis]GID85181.1 hypothetical protein Ade03nite_41050 [Actinoplanes derwentensis]SDS66877.1 mRNA interferase MazF [Actinoplanes derwentensis]